MQTTLSLSAEKLGINTAADLLSAGKLVAFPTETVYGLGADAGDDQAVAQIFEAKGRPRFNPLIAHVADLDMAESIAIFDDRARKIATAFWPGPLTLVLPLRPDARISPLVTAGLDTIALRLPAHPLAQAILAQAGRPIAAPSANPSGKVSPTRADHVLAGLSGKIAAVVMGGACDVGVESTIISLADTPKLLRPGGVATEAIEAVLGQPLARLPAASAAHNPNSPGQLASHYAPGAAVRLNVTAPEPDEFMVGFGEIGGQMSLSPSGDLREAAANLFHILREADVLAGENGRLAFAPIPQHGLGLAINDRLARAAAPRP